MPTVYRVFHLEFDIENEGFVYDKRGEIARILRKIASKIESGPNNNKIMDVNGNTIGSYKIIRKVI